ncbi:MAG: Spy/CpxP family protein refolding chaperone [Candidatus Omnitrophota bacterium]
MKTKMMWIVLAGMTVLLGSAAYAGSTEGCGIGRKGSHGDGRDGSKGECPITAKVEKKAHMILEKRADLGLTDEQVKAVEALKLKAEKDGIAQNAQRQAFMLDLAANLKEDKVDVEAANTLIDKNTSSSAAFIKSNVAAYAQLKAILTPEQLKKLSELKRHHEEK